MDFVFSTCLLCVAAAAVHCRCKSVALLLQRRCTVAAKALQRQCKGSALMLCSYTCGSVPCASDCFCAPPVSAFLPLPFCLTGVFVFDIKNVTFVSGGCSAVFSNSLINNETHETKCMESCPRGSMSGQLVLHVLHVRKSVSQVPCAMPTGRLLSVTVRSAECSIRKLTIHWPCRPTVPLR